MSLASRCFVPNPTIPFLKTPPVLIASLLKALLASLSSLLFFCSVRQEKRHSWNTRKTLRKIFRLVLAAIPPYRIISKICGCAWQGIHAFLSNIMGACFSSAPKQLIENTDGGEEAYHKRYMEGEVLGEGEFGQVRLVHDMTQDKDQNTPYASKLLKKGMVFKDNTLYSPIKVRGCVYKCISIEYIYRSIFLAFPPFSPAVLCRLTKSESPKFSEAKSRFSESSLERIIALS